MRQDVGDRVRRFSDPEAELLWSKAVIGLAFVSHDGSWIRVNPALCEMLEYTEDELTRGMRFQDVTHPADLAADEAMARRVAEGALDSYTMSKRYITKQGRVIWVVLKVHSVVGEGGQPALFLSQLSPPVMVDPPAEIVDPSVPDNQAPWRRFVSQNWRWLVVTGVAVAAWAINEAVDYRMMETRLESLEQRIGAQGPPAANPAGRSGS